MRRTETEIVERWENVSNCEEQKRKKEKEKGEKRGGGENEIERYTYYYGDKATENPCRRANFEFLLKFELEYSLS